MELTNKLILGTVQLGLDYGINNYSGKPTLDKSMNILGKARSLGIQVLDTAEAYGNAMDIIGEYHKVHEPFKIISKLKYSGIALARLIESQLVRLNVDHLHILFLHHFEDIFNLKVMDELNALKLDKTVSKIGVSVYTNEQARTVADLDTIDVIQLPFNLMDNYYQRGSILSYAKKNKKEIHARSVFLQGLFFMKEDRLPAKLNPLLPTLSQIKKIAVEEHFSIEQLALGYALYQQEIDAVLIGVDTESQLETNFRLSKIKLSPAIVEKINEIHVEFPELLLPINWN